MSQDPIESPRRLTEHGELGRVLRQANSEFRAGVNESRAFQRLQERRARPALRFAWPEFALVAAVGALALFGIGALRADRSAPAAVAESLRATPAQRNTTALPGRAETHGRGAPEGEHHQEGTHQPLAPGATARPSKALHSPPANKALAPAPPAPVPAPVVSAAPALPTDNSVDCLSLARQGDTAAAQRCFEQRAQGSGLSAEMAAYEGARLRRDVLGDPQGALAALTQYRQRFPNGSLRREADVSILELLVQLGRTQEALTQTEQLLAAPTGKERVAELRLLRARLFRKSGNVSAAAQEYRLVEQLGGAHADEARRRLLELEP